MNYFRRYLAVWIPVLVFTVFLTGYTQTASGASCTDYNGNSGHQITFVNNSNEAVVIGVFGSIFDMNDNRAVPDTGYSHPSNWIIGPTPGSSITWCVPAHFNGRFFARTGCDATGKCLTGNCCKEGTNCTGNVCTKTPEPTTLSEMFVDSKQGTYYDISFVDGYDFPLTLQLTDVSGCTSAGCTTPPLCQWGWLADGVCLAPYKMFEINYPDYRYRPEYYPLAAMCAQNMFLAAGDPGCCGCGKTKDCSLAACPTDVTVTSPYTGKPVTLKSSGCSPINKNYNNPGEGNDTEQYQITCDPTSDATTTYYGTSCNPWAAFYKSYSTGILSSCNGGAKVKSVYTWQYDDANGLYQCNNSSEMGFTLTVNPRDTKTPIKKMITFVPGVTQAGVPVTGTITVNSSSSSISFVGPDSAVLPVSDKDNVSISINCSNPGFTTTCNLVYASGKGFTVDTATSAPICSDTANFQNWGNSTIPLAYPDITWCSNKNLYRLQISPAPDVTGFVCVGSDTSPKAFSPSSNTPITTYLKDKDTFRLVQNCGNGSNGNQRIIDCTADFSLTGGFTPRVVSGASTVCTDGRINWGNVFANNNIGPAKWVTDVDCVIGTYTESCPVGYTVDDARTALKIHRKIPSHPTDPLKMDSNYDGRINQIDSIKMLRRSAGH